MDRIDTLIVARDRLFRDGFARIVGADFAVVGSPSLALALPEIEGGLRPRLLIMQVAAVDFEALQRVRSELPDVKTVLLIDSDQALPFAMPAQRDIDGYIETDTSPDTLKASLGLVMAGQTIMPSGLASARFRAQSAATPAPERRSLTAREAEVLQSLRRGRSNKEIARELDVSVQTVKVHMKTLLRKLQVRNRTEAAVSGMSRTG